MVKTNTMELQKLIKTMIFIAIPIFLSGCTKSETDKPDENSGGTLTATVNGNEFTSEGSNITATFIPVTDEIISLGMIAKQLSTTGNTEMIILAIVSGDGSGINQNDIYTSTSLTKNTACQYTLTSSSLIIKAHSDNTGIAEVKITHFDPEEKTISGTFNYDSSESEEPNVIYEIRNGKFTDIPFE